MNKQGKNKIDWTSYSWNPISGCLHDCYYCYLKRMKFFDMTPAFHPERLSDPMKVKKPSLIFTGSSADMFGDWVEDWWIDEVLAVVVSCKHHTFQFLTKNPKRYSYVYNQHCFKNLWFGTTDDGLMERAFNISILKENVTIPKRFVSFEPLLAEVYPDLTDIQWVIIGADSNKGAKKPPREWADRIIKEARRVGASVFVKDNYGYPEIIKEFPMGMKEPA